MRDGKYNWVLKSHFGDGNKKKEKARRKKERLGEKREGKERKGVSLNKR